MPPSYAPHGIGQAPAEEDLTHKLTNVSGKTCQKRSRVVATGHQGVNAGTALPVPSRRELSCSDEGMKMVEVAGVEPASHDLS